MTVSVSQRMSPLFEFCVYVRMDIFVDGETCGLVCCFDEGLLAGFCSRVVSCCATLCCATSCGWKIALRRRTVICERFMCQGLPCRRAKSSFSGVVWCVVPLLVRAVLKLRLCRWVGYQGVADVRRRRMTRVLWFLLELNGRKPLFYARAFEACVGG